VLDVLVAKVVLQSAGVVAIIGEFEAAGVPQHVRMDCKRQLGGLSDALDEMMKTHWADWPATFANEYVGFRRVLAPQRTFSLFWPLLVGFPVPQVLILVGLWLPR
jgi:hypothetical protein